MTTPSVIPLFPTPMASDRWMDTAELNGELAELIANKRAKLPSVVRSNVGGWHSELDFLDQDDACVRTLAERIKDFVSKVKLQFANRSAKSVEVTLQGWANVLDNGGYNSVHSHPNAEWSGVYYVTGNPVQDAATTPQKTDLAGKLELMDPRNGAALAYTEGSNIYGRCLLDPSPGQIVVFPGWLAHQVHPYQGTEPRLSIAFNTIES